MKIFNFIKKSLKLFSKKEKPRLTTQAIDELIEINKEVLSKLGDETDYDGMGNYGRFPPIKNNKNNN